MSARRLPSRQTMWVDFTWQNFVACNRCCSYYLCHVKIILYTAFFIIVTLPVTASCKVLKQVSKSHDIFFCFIHDNPESPPTWKSHNQFSWTSLSKGKGAMRLTLYEAPTCETRSDHNTGNFLFLFKGVLNRVNIGHSYCRMIVLYSVIFKYHQ